MVSIWWLLFAFLAGGCSGIFVMILMSLSGAIQDQVPQGQMRG